MEKMGGVGLQEYHRRSPILSKNECDRSLIDHHSILMKVHFVGRAEIVLNPFFYFSE